MATVPIADIIIERRLLTFKTPTLNALKASIAEVSQSRPSTHQPRDGGADLLPENWSMPNESWLG